MTSKTHPRARSTRGHERSNTSLQLEPRHLRLLRRLGERDGVSPAEALSRLLDEELLGGGCFPWIEMDARDAGVELRSCPERTTPLPNEAERAQWREDMDASVAALPEVPVRDERGRRVRSWEVGDPSIPHPRLLRRGDVDPRRARGRA